MERRGVPATAPVRGARVVISDLDGRELVAVLTDDDGGYRTGLASGDYRVTIRQLKPLEFTKDLPAIVTITEGLTTRLDVKVDTRRR